MSTSVSTGRYTRYGCVYRAYDTEGVLLYVGSTCDFESRKDEHLRNSIWRSQVARWSVRWHLNDWDARRAEAKAIRDEHPRWNIRHRSTDHPDGVVKTIAEVVRLHPANLLRPTNRSGSYVRLIPADSA